MKIVTRVVLAGILMLSLLAANVLAAPSQNSCTNPHRNPSAPAHGLHLSGHCA